MFCGIDLSHESGRVRASQSAVALVCSYDEDITRWTSRTSITNSGQTIVDSLSELFKLCLQQWKKVN